MYDDRRPTKRQAMHDHTETGRVYLRLHTTQEKQSSDRMPGCQKGGNGSWQVVHLTKLAVPEAKGALDKFKYEVSTQSWDVPLTDGYIRRPDIQTETGSVGGYMVKKMIEQQEKQMAGKIT